MADFLGIIAIVFFYVVILIVGVWAGRKTKNSKDCSEGLIYTKKSLTYNLAVGQETEEVMLAGRNIGTVVGIFTMTGKHLFFSSPCVLEGNCLCRGDTRRGLEGKGKG